MTDKATPPPLTPPRHCTEDETAQGQQVLYHFLTKVDHLSNSFERLDRRVSVVETTVGGLPDALHAVREELKEVKAIVTPMHDVWEKVKSGALVLLAVYFLRDAPELLKPVLALLAK